MDAELIDFDVLIELSEKKVGSKLWRAKRVKRSYVKRKKGVLTMHVIIGCLGVEITCAIMGLQNYLVVGECVEKKKRKPKEGSEGSFT